MKALKKNKKGFTLVEVIVVLLIIGILLAITIPSIIGYVDRAKEAQFKAEGRTGFVSAQSLTATHNATATGEADITALAIGKDLGELADTATAVDTNSTIQTAGCAFDTNRNITKCAFTTKGSGASKYVVFEGNKDVTVTTTKPTDITLK